MAAMNLAPVIEAIRGCPDLEYLEVDGNVI